MGVAKFILPSCTHTPQNKELQSKLQQLRRSTELDLEESLRDHTLRFDREKQQLKQDNKDLQTQIDKVKESTEKAHVHVL